MSNFEIGTSPSIFQLERRSKAQNVRNAHGYLSGISNFRYSFRLKKFVASSNWRPFWIFLNNKHSFNLTSDIKRSSLIMQKSVFWWWRHRWRHRVASKFLYIHVYDRVAPGANCKGNVSSINANIIIVFLGYTWQQTISMNNTFRDCKSKVDTTGLLGDLGTNKQHCKLSQIQLFSRLWRHR